MNRIRIALVASLLASGFLAAHEEPFGYVRGAQTEPPGEWEVTQWTTARMGKESGHYLGMDFNTEIELGITRRLQMAAYLNTRYHHLRDVEGSEEVFEDRNRFGLDGGSVEIKYQLLSPDNDAFGLSLYFEPGYHSIRGISGQSGSSIEFETILILQKNFFAGRLVTAFNFVVEPELEREDGDWETELEMAWTAGASWRLTPHWRIGAEARLGTAFPHSRLNSAEYLAFFLGPALHYQRNSFFGTLTVFPQIAGWPDAQGTGGLHLDETERLEIRLKLGIEF
ncbi:MAG: hypothetical protein EXS36_14690 [Pedosphaera sp.]|nr:hypothetical protein [Pedosphaera sp.]